MLPQAPRRWEVGNVDNFQSKDRRNSSLPFSSHNSCVIKSTRYSWEVLMFSDCIAPARYSTFPKNRSLTPGQGSLIVPSHVKWQSLDQVWIYLTLHYSWSYLRELCLIPRPALGDEGDRDISYLQFSLSASLVTAAATVWLSVRTWSKQEDKNLFIEVFYKHKKKILCL
jgi:hypothetical protein